MTDAADKAFANIAFTDADPTERDRRMHRLGFEDGAAHAASATVSAPPDGGVVEPPAFKPLTGIEHELKTDSPVFEEVVRGRKRFEIRKDDRGFQCGDILNLRETRLTGSEMAAGQPLMIYTGRSERVRVIGILRGPIYGLAEGWVIMSISPLPERTPSRLTRVAALPEVVAWQDIATAPKDGSVIQLWREDLEDPDEPNHSAVVPGRWIEGDDDGPDCMGSDGGFMDLDFQEFTFPRSFGAPKYRTVGRQPTHWAPLSAPPVRALGVIPVPTPEVPNNG